MGEVTETVEVVGKAAEAVVDAVELSGELDAVAAPAYSAVSSNDLKAKLIRAHAPPFETRRQSSSRRDCFFACPKAKLWASWEKEWRNAQ